MCLTEKYVVYYLCGQMIHLSMMSQSSSTA